MDPIIICVAPNGARKTTKDHPNLPVTPETLAKTAEDVVKAGAAMIHLHVRDAKQGHSLDVGIYSETIAAIRDKVGQDIIIQITTEEVGIYEPKEQMQTVLDLRPEACSLALREFIREPSEEANAVAFFKDVAAQGTMPQYILYNQQEIEYFGNLRKKGLIPGEEVAVLFVLGRKQAVATNASSFATPDDIEPFLETFDGDLKLAETLWSICAFGRNENECLLTSVNCGGHVRVGFENNHLLPDGKNATDNAQLVQVFMDSVGGNPRLVATAEQARELMKKTIIL